MADRIEDTPDGPVRIPDALGEGEWAQRGFIVWQGDRVEITFLKGNIDLAGDPDGAVATGVSKIWMSRQDFSALVDMDEEARRQIGK